MMDFLLNCKKSKLFFTHLFFILIIVSSCSLKDENLNKKIFTYNEPSNITSLDPAYSRSMSNIWAVNQIFNGLVQLDSELKVIPCIAYDWNISDDGKKYTFFLRSDVFFHNDISIESGRKVNAYDFEYSFKRIIDEKIASPGTWIFQRVKRNEKNDYLFYAVDDTTFVIELEDGFPPFLGLLAMQYCSVVPKESVEYYGDNFRSNPVGTGPFEFAYWKENVKLVLLKNSLYFETDSFGKNLPYIDAVNITFIQDRQTAFLDFLKGNIDMISGIDASYKDALLNKKGELKNKYIKDIYMQTEPFLNTEYLGFQLDENSEGFKNNALLDVRVRQAINYCFDRKKMIQYLRNNIGTAGNYGMVPPYMPGFEDNINHGYYYSVEKAKKLLKDASYPNGEGLQPITLTTTANYLDLCQYIQHEASKVGIIIKIDVTPPATLREMNANGKIEFFRASWIADYPDAENYLSLFYSENFSPNGPNYTRFFSKEFDEIYKKSTKITNDSIRQNAYLKLDSIIINQAPVVILYYDKVVRFVRKNVLGIYTNPMNLLTLKYVKKD